MRYLISGGGTGGHIFPAIALAQALEGLDAEAEFLFVGALGKMEMERVPQAGYRIEGLRMDGFQRNFSLRNLMRNLALPFKLSWALVRAWFILRRFRPAVVVGVGGYASAAMVKMAQWLGIPTLIHEQNAHAGATNRALGKKAKQICVAYPNMQRFFPAERLIETGNPIRRDLLQLDREAAAQTFFKRTGLDPNKPLVFILGGSLGAKRINEAVARAWSAWVEAGLQVYWQVGKLYLEQYQDLNQAHEALRVVGFVEDMAGAYAAADMAVSRAGALSLAELCFMNLPCILLPSPNVAEDHQTTNARSLVEAGAACLLRDDEALEKLGSEVLSLWADAPKRMDMQAALAKLARPYAAEDLARTVMRLATA